MLTKILWDNIKFAKPLFFIYLAFVFVITQMPGSEIEKENNFISIFAEIKNIDKYVHASIFFLMVILLCLTYPKIKPWSLIIIPLSYSIIIEIFQYILPFERSFDLLDILANFIGILLATLLCQYWFRPYIIKNTTKNLS